MYSPIALFIYNRETHLPKMIESLKNNLEFELSPFYVFCDGPKDDDDFIKVQAARGVIRTVTHPNIKIIESENNKGLAQSIIDGVTYLCDEFGSVIVLEDDLIVSKYFLNYMNTSLAKYKSEKNVFQISAYSFQSNTYKNSDGSSFLPMTTSWGWGTWKRAWDNFDNNMNGYDNAIKNIKVRKKFNWNGAYPYTRIIHKLKKLNRMDRSWAVRWHWTVFKNNGFVLFPHKTLVMNIGNDGIGTNSRLKLETYDSEYSNENKVNFFPDMIKVDLKYFDDMTLSVKKYRSIINRIKRFLQGMI